MRVEANGIEVAWFEVGRGEPVVLIHGLADDHRAWRRVLAPLAIARRAILYDLRGHGQTEFGDADGTLRQLGDDLVALLDALELPRVTLAGFSLGGTVAMRAAIDHPGRVVALALVATSSRVNAAARAWYETRARLVDDGDPELRTTLDADTRDVYRNRPDEIADGLTIRRQSTADARGYANACRAMAALNQAPLDDELGSIAVPTAILAGDADRHCPPRAGEIVAARIAESTLQVLPDTGHPIPVERPDEVAAAIAALGSG